uniref:Putative concanavalin A-like lectin/glucanase domain, Serine/threonine-protein kinase Unc-51 n=1 Tax=Helianthus annuus TaxID=4232 RepID=A0A251S2A9_HELAN
MLTYHIFIVSSSNKVGIIGGVVGGLGGLIFLLIIVIWWYGRSKRTKPKGATELQYGPNDYSYSHLRKATNDFGDENKLGRGGFGDVYKAILDNKKVVAVKKLKVGYVGAKVEFANEILLVSQICHRNLLGLLGWCIDDSNLLLVLEYMPNGSLDKFLWGEGKGSLNWKRRYDIILGIARGLAHLHKESHVRILHRDIKSSNILLDDDFQPKIADFGLARFQPEDQSQIITKFVGTLGYTAPEYVRYGVLSDKADTYSFGIVVLEIVSGRTCTSQGIDGPSTNFLLEHISCMCRF